MDIRFYENFTKRPKSTKTPDSSVFTWGTTVRLKQDTSIYNPTFLMSSSVIKTFNFNYCLWDNKYYFVDDVIKGNNNVWEIQCSLDKLATLKSDIKNTSAYVLYSTSKYNNMLPDSRLNFSTIDSIGVFTTHFKDYSTDMNTVIQFISNTNTHNLPTAYALLSNQQMDNICNALMSNEFSDSLEKQLDSTASAIVGCKKFVFTPLYKASPHVIHLGNYQTSAVGYYLSDNLQEYGSVTIEFKYYTDLDFRVSEPYCKWVIYLCGYGYVELPSDYMYYCYNHDNKKLTLNYCIDQINGTITWVINGIGKFDGVVAINIPVAYSGINAINTISAIAGAGASFGGAIGSAVAGNPLGVVSGLAGGVSKGFEAIITANTKVIGTQGANSGSVSSITSGNFGSFSPILFQILLKNDESINSITDTLGKPLKQVISLSGLSGYVQTVGACVSSNYPKYIVDEVNSLLDGGIYLE